MQMKIYDKIRFAMIFFKSLWTDADTMNVQIALSEEGNYILLIDDAKENKPCMMYR